MIKPKIKSVVFDLDDTLYPEKDFQQGGFRAVANFINQQGSFKITTNKITALNKKYPGQCFNMLIKQYDLSVSPDNLIAIYHNHRPKISPFPGLTAVLAKLKKKYNLKLGLLSDCHLQSKTSKLKALKIQKFLDALIFTKQLGTPKPMSLSYVMIKKRFKCPDASIIYVGDNEQKDFIGARKSGFITVKFKHKNSIHRKIRLDKEYRADYEIRDHQELFRIIDQINNPPKIKMI